MRQILTALLAALASWPAIATELVETANALPLDAHELSYGDGWECNRGFKKRNQSCVKITAAFQDILELDCCNCNASDFWSKFDSSAIRVVGASRCRYDIVCRQLFPDVATTIGSARRFARHAIPIFSPNCRFQVRRFDAGFTEARPTSRLSTYSTTRA